MRKTITLLVAFVLCVATFAQEKKTPEQREKEFYEAIEKQVEHMTEQLNLNDAQVFYVDSILTHDYKAMQDEVNNMSAAKMTNTDLYYDVQDKWMEQMYQAMRKVLDDGQWAQYEKSGAARDKKARDKRAAKKLQKTTKK